MNAETNTLTMMLGTNDMKITDELGDRPTEITKQTENKIKQKRAGLQ